jgi:hypothetical protein
MLKNSVMEFTTELLLSGKSATGLRVPDEVIEGSGRGGSRRSA